MYKRQGSLLHRPDVVAAIGKQSLNLNRLNREMDAISNTQNKTAILYSKAARVYDISYTEVLHNTYKACIGTGFGVDFVTEYSPKKMMKYDTVIIPQCKNIAADTLKQLYDFSKRGKKVVLVGKDNLLHNEYNQNSYAEYKNFVTDNALLIEKTDYDTLINEIYKIQKGVCKVELLDEKTLMPVTGLDWKWTLDDNYNLLVNVSNYEFYDKSVKLYIDGDNYAPYEMITDEQLGKTFTVKSLEPMLLKIEFDEPQMLSGIRVERNMLTWNNENDAVAVYSVKNGKKFLKVVSKGFEPENGEVYLLCRYKNKKLSAGRIVSFLQEKCIFVTENENGYSITNIGEGLAAGAAVTCVRENGVLKYAAVLNVCLEPVSYTHLSAGVESPGTGFVLKDVDFVVNTMDAVTFGDNEYSQVGENATIVTPNIQNLEDGYRCV